jgi:hypothetical protein
MPKRSQNRKMNMALLLLVLAAALFVAKAISQQIVIEPTNGDASKAARAQAGPNSGATVRAKPPTATSSRPEAKKRAPAQPPAVEDKTPAVGEKSLAVREKTAEIHPAPAAATTEAEPEEIPATKRIPERPQWAMTEKSDTGALQQEIAQALAHDPKLAHSTIQVQVDESAITLRGRVGGGEQRLEAQRLAQSYAWDRKLVDRIEVGTGR